MKLYIPYKQWIITQKFEENANSYYKEAGRKGHGAWDLVGLGDKNIFCSHDGYIFSVLNKDNPDLMKYRAVYTLIEDSGIFYELSYGHFDKIFVEEGEIKKGQVLGTEGNTGNVASGGVKVTLEAKKKALPNMPGRHLHWQLRQVLPVDKKVSGKKYLTNSKGTFKKDGKYFEVLNYDNGYNGCIDIGKFVVEESVIPKTIIETVANVFKPQFKRVLKYGSRGEDVKTLQSLLGIKADGIFGVGTRQAVMNFQKANKLIVDGIAGAQTFATLLK